ncbi:hypothetical protein [Eubacterium sp.]|uniref:hypothetical protein n=1 Tax=Eubacterium sp. TaxID=142586 RepID=UPI003F0073F3
MEFNWINIYGGIVVALMMIPNIIFAVKNKEHKPNKSKRIVNIIEQISRYACIIIMILPLFVWEFGFSPLGFMFVYVIGNIILLILYYIFWGLYSKSKTCKNALALAIIPTLIFINSAISVKHWALLVTAVIFGVSHIYITYINNK